jgi:hypothetical protein
VSGGRARGGRERWRPSFFFNRRESLYIFGPLGATTATRSRIGRLAMRPCSC